jgi:predicted O-methyltransferase YrrM
MNRQEFLIDKFGDGDKVIIRRTRDGFYPLLEEMGVKIGCEVGASFGKNAEELLLNVPSMKLFLVDSFVQHNKRHSAKQIEKMLARRLKRVRSTRLADVELIRKDSADAAKHFEDESLDFIYIDANHAYSSVVKDIGVWYGKLKRGGVFGGHDYYKVTMKEAYGVVAAVDEYTGNNNIKPLFITDDRARSFFWIKP